jgi:hypothetical protein
MKIKNQDSDEAGIDPLEYIRSKGYASYSSLSSLRKGEPIVRMSTVYYDFGSELHARFLEGKSLKRLSEEEETILDKMLTALDKDKLVRSLMKHPEVKTERKFNADIKGVPVLGYVDIDAAPVFLSDLKTTSARTRQKFISSMDFLQAALYRKVRATDDFYYIGISKVQPFEVFTFNVMAYPERLQEADQQLEKLLSHVRKNVFNKKG